MRGSGWSGMDLGLGGRPRPRAGPGDTRGEVGAEESVGGGKEASDLGGPGIL